MNEKDQEKRPSSVSHSDILAPRTPHNEAADLLKEGNVNAKLANPLAGKSRETLLAEAEAFAAEYGLKEHTAVIQKGALVAQDPLGFELLQKDLTEADRQDLRDEIEHKWRQPKELYYLVVMCSLAAAVQGMDETVINGAQLFYPDQLGIPQPGLGQPASKNTWILGLVNSAPYLCCAVLGCWLTEPLNRYFGRRGAIFITATLSFLTCIWQGVTNSWQHLFVARFVLGLGIGPKSSTVPVFAAECAPAAIRGALVMMWQMWTAFGIMFGYVADLAFFHVPDKPHITGLRWRLMLASAGIPALFVMAQVYLCPESPRWLMGKGRYQEAYKSLLKLRGSELRAARDLYYIHVLIQAESSIKRDRNLVRELFAVPRNRRAALASFIVMFMQQFCGVNAIAYYSSTIFKLSNFSDIQALLASWGFGMINFVFAIPAIYTIDTFGRRGLLLTTFPLMAIFLLMTGFAFFIHGRGQLALVALGIYLFTAVYSPGEGPVPFTYSAEAYPLYIRDVGMSFATATTWFFNFVIAITTPSLIQDFTPQGAFGWYAGWNVIGWFAILLAVPETKSLSLEELDQVFSVPTGKHAAYQIREIPIWFKRFVLRRKDVERQPPLYQHEESGEKTYAPVGAAAA